MASERAQQAVSNLSTELEHLPERVSLVPSLITSLVDEQPIPMSSDEACRIRKLRHDTGNAAVAYIKCVLPLEQLCISDIKGFFEHYQYLAMDEWWKRIKITTQEVKEHKEVCDTLVAVHEYLMTKLKQQEDNATKFMNERKYLADKLEREATKFRNQGKAVVGVGSVLSGALPFLVSPIGAVVAGVVIATSSLLAAKTKMDQSGEKDKEAKKESAAVADIEKTVIPVLSKFSSALNCMSGLFAALQEELETLQKKGEKAMEEEPTKLHYKVMKGKAKRIIERCTNSREIIHSSVSNVETILATKKLDVDYVEKSLLEVKHFISKKCANGKVIDKMMKALCNSEEVTDRDKPINGDRNQNKLSAELNMKPEEVENYLDTVALILIRIPDNMRQFSLCMRSLFAEYAVGTSSDTARRFRELRDDARNNAVVYVKGVLPIIKECVSDIKSFFEYYNDLTIDEWWEGLEEIVEETKAQKEAFSALIAIHDDITATMNKQQDEAKSLIDELTKLSIKYEKEANELNKAIEIEEHSNAMAFDREEPDGYVHVEHAAFSSTEESMPGEAGRQKEAETGKAAEEDSMQVEAIAKKNEAEIEKAAAEVVGDKSIPALNKSITGIKGIASVCESDGYVHVEHAASSSTEESMPGEAGRQKEAETGKAAEEDTMQVEAIVTKRQVAVEKGAEKKLMLVQAIAKKKETEIQKAAAEVVGDKLIPALNKFITGIKEVAGIFEVMEEDLATFGDKVNNIKEMEKKMQLHYNTMKGKAGQMMRGCNKFFAVLPSVRSDMGAIPTEGTDQNYVDRWMEKEKKIIMEKCSQSSMVKKIRKQLVANSN